MKRLVALLMTACLLGTMLVGCGAKEEAAAPAAGAAETEAAAEEAAPAEAAATATAGNVTIWYYWETEGHQ